jgi:L-fucose isomerase-like protein
MGSSEILTGASPVVGFVTCVHPIYALPSVLQHRDSAISGLQAAGCGVIDAGLARNSQDTPGIIETLKEQKIDLLLFFFCTWVAEGITLSIASEMEKVPLLLWALPYFDLCVPMPSPMTGITATGCNLRRAGRNFVYRIGEVNAGQVRSIAGIARSASLVGRLRETRFGVFGDSCPGMIDTECDASLLEKHLGVAIFRDNIESLLQARDASSAGEALELALKLAGRVNRCEVELGSLVDQCRLFLGMKSLVQANSLDGFTVRCWPELRDAHKATICLAMALLADEGIASTCEADITALITSYILSFLAGKPSCTLEITAYLEEESALQMAHCGSAAMSLAGAGGTALRGHMRTGAGAMVESGLAPGLVTIAKLLRPFEGGLKIFVGRGEVIPSGGAARGSVAAVRVEPSPALFIDSMLRYGVEHHLVLVYGDWTEELARFAQFAEIEFVSTTK